MIATRNVDVDDLNWRARQRLAAAGHIGPDQIMLSGRCFAVGDEVLATRNDYSLGVLNGTRATISHIDVATGAIHATVDGRQAVLPRSYADAGFLTHAYAMTFHKTQGMTAGETFLLADDTLDRQRAYTGLSRGTHRNALYIVESPNQRSEERHAPEPVSDAVARARLAMARLLDKSMATDHVEPNRGLATSPTSRTPSHPSPAEPDLGPDLGL